MRDEQRKVTVLHAHVGDFGIDKGFDLLPEKIGPWTKNVAAGDVVVFDQFTFANHLPVPICKILFLLELDTQSDEEYWM